MWRGWAAALATALAVANTVQAEFGPSTSSGSTRHLEREWELSLGTGQRGSLYRLAVCSDGQAWFTDGRGRLTRLSPFGQIEVDVIRDELSGSKAVVCHRNGQVTVAVSTRAGSRLVKSESAPGSVLVLHVTGTSLPTVFALAANDGQVFALAPQSETGRAPRFLHRLLADGRVAQSFGQAPVQVSERLTQDVLATGSFAWSAHDGSLVFAPAAPYELHWYSPEGSLLRTAQRADADFTSPTTDFLDQDGPEDRVMSLAVLPAGEYVTFVVKQRSGQSQSYLEVLDHRANVRATGISISGDGGYGVLQGSTVDGALYFLKATPASLTVSRARLVAG